MHLIQPQPVLNEEIGSVRCVFCDTKAYSATVQMRAGEFKNAIQQILIHSHRQVIITSISACRHQAVYFCGIVVLHGLYNSKKVASLMIYTDGGVRLLSTGRNNGYSTMTPHRALSNPIRFAPTLRLYFAANGLNETTRRKLKFCVHGQASLCGYLGYNFPLLQHISVYKRNIQKRGKPKFDCSFICATCQSYHFFSVE